MRERVLVIDSDQGFPSELNQLVSAKELQMDAAASQQEAWARIAENHYTAIFLNLRSANESDLVREVRGRVRNYCQIFVAGPSDVALAVKAMQSGAQHYWQHPVSAGDMKKLFEDGTILLDQSRLRYQREETLLQIIKEIALTMELEGLVNILMDSTMELTEADGAAFLLLDDRTNVLTLRSIRGLSGNEGLTEFFGMPERKYFEILMTRQPSFLKNLDITISVPSGEKLKEAIIAPIWFKEEPLGVLVTAKFHSSHRTFSNDDYKVISLLVEEIAGAVHNAITHYKTKELTIKDDLTEAYNRRYFERYLEEEFMRARRYNSHLSLIFFDVDNLKEVNQRFGHLIGSKTLQEIAHRMILTVRGIDKVVRYGGDEFCIVLPETDTQGAYQVADRIRSIVAAKPFRVNESVQVQLTGSMGIASFPAHANSKEDLVRKADQAMFVIKNKTKNAIAVAEPLTK